MSTPETDLFPEELLEDAFSSERPAADAFAAGVRERVADAERAGRDDLSRYPLWIRRAAVLLPPGVVDMALLGKLGGAAKGAGSGAALLAPWALVAIAVAGLVGALGLTSGLDASAADGADPQELRRRLRRGPTPYLVSLLMIVPFALLLYGLFSRSTVTIASVFAFAGLVLVVTLRVLSRQGIADRRFAHEVTAFSLATFVGMSFMIPSAFAGFAGPWTVYGTPALLLSTQALLALRAPERSQLHRRLSAGASLAFAVLITVAMRAVLQAPFGADEADLRAWVEACDGRSGELGVWEEFGHAADVLGPQSLDLSLPGAALERLFEDDAPPSSGIALAAWRSGLLDSEDARRYAPRPRLLANALARGTLSNRLRRSDLLEAIALSETEPVDPAWSAAARAALERALPEPGEIGQLEKAWIALETAQVLGLDDYAERHAERLYALLVDAWDPTGPGYRLPGGFGNWIDGDDGRRVRHPDTKYTLHAVRLMAAVGAPASIDLHLLDAFLSEELRSHQPSEPHPYDVQAAVARHLLREHFAVGRRPLIERLGHESIFLTALALCALSLWVVRRAPLVALSAPTDPRRGR